MGRAEQKSVEGLESEAQGTCSRGGRRSWQQVWDTRVRTSQIVGDDETDSGDLSTEPDSGGLDRF